MANRVLSIEVGESFTYFSEMDFRAKNPRVYKCFSIPTPDGVYDDGFITENAEYITAIKQALAFHKVKTKQAVCSIMSSKIATREVQLPNVKNNQVQPMVEANATEYFPINLEDYELGHLVLGNVKDANGVAKLKVLVMACQKLLIESYDKLCEACGLHLISVDYTGNSIYQVMKNECIEDTEMIIRIGEKTSLATIISDHSMVMQRNIVYGAEGAVFSLMESTAFPQKTFNEAFEELKRIECVKPSINETSILTESANSIQFTEKTSAAMQEITESLSPLVGNLARVIDLYNSKTPDKPIKRIVLTGFGAEINGISKLFTNELGVSTVVCNSIRNIPIANANDDNTGKYAVVIGAGLLPVGFINEEKKVNDLKEVNYKNVSILLGILFALICIAMIGISYARLSVAKTAETLLKSQEATYLPAEAVQIRHDNMAAFLAEIADGYNLSSSENDGLVEFFEKLESTLPDDAEIRQFTSDTQRGVMIIALNDFNKAGKLIEEIRNFYPDDSRGGKVTISSIVQRNESEVLEEEGSEENEGSEEDKEDEESLEPSEEEEEVIWYEITLNIDYNDLIEDEINK